MYLHKLEIQGFKTFAKKTVINFPPENENSHSLTVIVGPNGSGKSNIADAIRWCLGEQSMKQLRGQKTEDIIFSGSKGKVRSGFAEVKMTFDNTDHALKLDFKEITITRRIYRDGDSEYLLNNKKVRLSDIKILLAEAGIGQRTYTVVAQGMIDHVLTSSPEERKVFFDDATGVRSLQMKRQQSISKLKKASQNLSEIEMLTNQIEPRLRILRRQVSRIKEREGLEIRLNNLQKRYYGTMWQRFSLELSNDKNHLSKVNKEIQNKRDELKTGDAKLLDLEKQTLSNTDEDDKIYRETQQIYKNAQKYLSKSREIHFEAERDLELARVRSQSSWSPLPLTEIIRGLDAILRVDQNIGVEKVVEAVRNLRDRLTKPQSEKFIPDEKLLNAIQIAKQEVESAKTALNKSEDELSKIRNTNKKDTSAIFDSQRKLRALQNELNTLEQKANSVRIDLAKIETRRDQLLREVKEELNLGVKYLESLRNQEDAHIQKTREEMLGIKRKLEMIGAIDENVEEEYKETQEKYTFLMEQSSDLKKAVESSEKLISELDTQIKTTSEKALKAINIEFQKYFKLLFEGGSCSIVKLQTDEKEESQTTQNRAMEQLSRDYMEGDDDARELSENLKKNRRIITGIDIQATPPGKKLKSLNLLSGGERALTSIALLSAIMTVNPSPFVVLDEVDAALDEANTLRFAKILNELRKLTQFIVVTHNRATMESADLLYGVTMGDDGISNLVSVNMTDLDSSTGVSRR